MSGQKRLTNTNPSIPRKPQPISSTTQPITSNRNSKRLSISSYDDAGNLNTNNVQRRLPKGLPSLTPSYQINMNKNKNSNTKKTQSTVTHINNHNKTSKQRKPALWQYLEKRVGLYITTTTDINVNGMVIPKRQLGLVTHISPNRQPIVEFSRPFDHISWISINSNKLSFSWVWRICFCVISWSLLIAWKRFRGSWIIKHLQTHNKTIRHWITKGLQHSFKSQSCIVNYA